MINDFYINYLIESNDLSTEIYTDQNELEKYIMSLEEAVEVVDKLQKRYEINKHILENTLPITDDTIITSNEEIAINCEIVGYDNYIRVSTEANLTRYEMLKLSNEGIGDIIKAIVDKIVIIFNKVIIMFKKVYAKIILWLNPYESRIQNIRKDISIILQRSDVSLPHSYFFPVLSAALRCKIPNDDNISTLRTNNFKQLLDTQLDVSTSFERLLNDKTLSLLLNAVSEGKDISSSTNSKLFTKFEKNKSKELNGCVLVCEVSKNNIDYIITKNTNDGFSIEYDKIKKENTINIESSFESESSNLYTFNRQDVLNYADNLYKKLIKDLKNNGNQLFSIQDKLVDIIKSEISKGNIKDSNNNTVKTAIYIGARAAVSHVFWLFDSIKAGLKVCYLLHDLLVNNIHNYTKLIQYYKENGFDLGNANDLEIRYLHGNKKYPYIHIPYNSLHPNMGGFCLPKYEPLYTYFGNNDYRSVIHIHDLSRDITLVKIVFNLTSFIDQLYFHEMGHAILQSNDEIASSFYEAYFKAAEIGGSTQIIENYVNSIIENQADAFAIYKLGMRISSQFNLYKPILKKLGISNNKIDELLKTYENNIKKQIPLVSKYARQSTWAKMKSLFRDYGNK